MRITGAIAGLAFAVSAAPALAEGAPPSQFMQAMQDCGGAVGPGPVDKAKLAEAGWLPPVGLEDDDIYIKDGTSVSISTFINPADGSGLCRLEGDSRLTGPQMATALVQVLGADPVEAEEGSITWIVAERIVVLSYADGERLSISVMEAE